MSTHPGEQQHYPALESVLDAIAHWVTRFREAQAARAELAACDADEVARVAQELNISPSELADLAGKSADSAALLRKMLVALGIDPDRGSLQDPLLARDLQRLCVLCSHKRQCAHELAAGTAAAHYGDFCPNAYTLDMVLGRRHQSPIRLD